MARLTEPERQELIRFIEADKPLPEKFRFLLFDDRREVELVWNGKTNDVCNVVLPFQTSEQVDEPRAEKPEDTAAQQDLFSTDSRGRQLKGWTNKLIWGDNKLILSSLKNRPLREEIERQGGLKLIYIDRQHHRQQCDGGSHRQRQRQHDCRTDQRDGARERDAGLSEHWQRSLRCRALLCVPHQSRHSAVRNVPALAP